MRPSATGQILFWRGGSLWLGLAGEATGLHAHHAVQIALPFPRGRVQFQDSAGKWTSYPAAIVPTEKGSWRRERDSNPRRAFDPYTLSRGAPSTTRPSLRAWERWCVSSLAGGCPAGPRAGRP